MICIECPQGCLLDVEVDTASGKVKTLTGNKCPKGQQYAYDEVEAPVRMLTTTVRAKAVPLKGSLLEQIDLFQKAD